MKQIFSKMSLRLLCLMAAMFSLTSFTAAQTRGGGDEYPLLEFYISGDMQNVETEIPYLLGEQVIFDNNTTPYWVSFNPGSCKEYFCLNVEQNYLDSPREASFTVTIYKDSGMFTYQIHLVQEGRGY